MKAFLRPFLNLGSSYFIVSFLPLSAVITTGEFTLLIFSVFIFGLFYPLLVRYLNFGFFLQGLLTLLTIFSIFILGKDLGWFILIVLFLVGIFFAKFFKFERPRFFLAIFIFLFLFGSLLSAQDVTDLTGQEPPNENYNHDSYIFLKTAYLMKEGNPYYKAFDQAVLNDVRAEGSPSDLFQYRTPTLILFLSLLPNPGFSAWIIFLILSSVLIIASYQIAQKFAPNPFSLIAPYLLIPYLLFASKSHWFLIMEWWSMFFIILFLAFFLHKKTTIAFVFISLSFFVRELAVIPIVANLLLSILFKNKKYLLFFLGVFLVSLIFYLIHIYFVSANGIDIFSSSPKRLLGGGFLFLRTTLAFATQNYFSINWGFQNMAFYFLVTLFGGFFAILANKKERLLILISYLTFLSFPFVFLFVSASRFNDYWGIVYVPIMISLLPWSLSSLNICLRKFTSKFP